ncbi:LON peptidase substrate-binding domain-containing protein [Bordetella genomosp. 13]|uniref:LON peptidase substrate-binding domain-containing protein n=1 Tax=Bordetella genomosp. 13 TaxID=463040 RepID=UPI0011A24E03|nr:LON peptidase substrate-binding domain-containing protein [Bordetella genomosp. 13]
MAEIPLFPLSNALFPAGVLHLRIFEVRYLDMIRRCLADGTEFGVVVLLAGNEVRTPEGSETLATVGTMARIVQCDAPMPALLEVACAGTTRFRLVSAKRAQYGLWLGQAEPLPQPPEAEVPHDLQPSADALGQLIAGMQRDGVPAASMPLAPPFRLDECGWVADRWAELLQLRPAEKARLLGLDDPVARLRAIQDALQGLSPAPDDDAA